MMFGTSIIDDLNLRGRCASLETGSNDMTETSVMRELAVRELDPNLGNLGGADGTRLDGPRAIATGLELRTLKQVQPTYDFEIAKISAWCRKHGYTGHVSLRGELELRKKQRSVKKSRVCF